MKLNTKLKISFLTMVILPIALCFLVFSFITAIVENDMKNKYDTENITSTYTMTPIPMLSKMTNAMYDEIKSEALRNPERFGSQEYLESVAEKVKMRFSSFVVRKNGRIIYSNSSDLNQKLNLSLLPE